MADKPALINIDLGSLSKPATVLIEKLSDAIGVVYDPKRIIRKAKAEAEAKELLAKADRKVEQIEKRAINRLLTQQTRKQENIENITKEAIQNLPEDAHVGNIEEDWIIDFFSKCENVSNRDMQSLWGKILSGEARKPGSFSKRTVLIVSTLDQRDAELFAKLSQFIWLLPQPSALIYDYTNPIYTKAGINFETLQHLDSIGLISLNNLSDYLRQGFEKEAFFVYKNEGYRIEFNQNTNNQIITGKVLLTSIGMELASICSTEGNEEFKSYVLQKWASQNIQARKA